MVMHWGKFKYFFEQVTKKNHSKLHLHVKVIFGKKDLQSFSKEIFLAPNYKFKPKILFHGSNLNFGCGFNLL